MKRRMTETMAHAQRQLARFGSSEASTVIDPTPARETPLPFSMLEVKRGKEKLADLVKELLALSAPRLLLAVESSPDALFEPLLFSHLTGGAPPSGLGAVLYPYLEPELRRESTTFTPDSRGVIYLPRVGYFRVQAGEGEASRFEPILTVSGTALELLRYDHPLFQRHYGGATASVFLGPVSLPLHHRDHLARAVSVIRRVWPTLAELMEEVTRRVHVFHALDVNSFATLAAYGCAFLNAGLEDDEVFFIEDLVHQCGHILFSAVTFEGAVYLAVAGDTPLGSLTGDRDERRTLYVALHGLVTEALMTRCLARCHEEEIFTGKKRQELLGRLSFIFRRLHRDLQNLAFRHVYTSKGAELYEFCCTVFNDVFRKHGTELGSLDMEGQGYTFDYRRFDQRNPMRQS